MALTALQIKNARPGEKLSEELFATGEEPQGTAHEKILVARGSGHWTSDALEARFWSPAAAAIGPATRLKPTSIRRRGLPPGATMHRSWPC